jgi:hypothetical protein
MLPNCGCVTKCVDCAAVITDAVRCPVCAAARQRAEEKARLLDLLRTLRYNPPDYKTESRWENVMDLARKY